MRNSYPIAVLMRWPSWSPSRVDPRDEEVFSFEAEIVEENAGLRTVYTGEDGGETTGPWVVHVLEVDPDRYDGTLEPELATEVVPERELLSGSF